MCHTTCAVVLPSLESCVIPHVLWYCHHLNYMSYHLCCGMWYCHHLNHVSYHLCCGTAITWIMCHTTFVVVLPSLESCVIPPVLWYCHHLKYVSYHLCCGTAITWIMCQSINQYKLFWERSITESINIFLQLYMIMSDLLTCHQDLVRGGCYFTILT